MPTFSDLGPIPPNNGPEHESPLQIQSVKCMTSELRLWRSRLASQSVMHVPDDKQPCSRPCGSSVGRHLKTLDSISARHWTLSLRAEPNGLPTNDMAKSEKEVPSTAGERARHEAQAGSQPRKSPFHRDKWPWSVVAVLLPRPIRVWKQVTDQHIELIGPVARANLVGVHYHHVP